MNSYAARYTRHVADNAEEIAGNITWALGDGCTHGQHERDELTDQTLRENLDFPRLDRNRAEWKEHGAILVCTAYPNAWKDDAEAAGMHYDQADDWTHFVHRAAVAAYIADVRASVLGILTNDQG